jgi:group I intron endonuclease
MTQCTIYKLTNRINQKVYVGQTWKTLEERFNNGEGYESCPYLYNAIKKYGIDKFSYEVIGICYNQEIADKMESVFIEYFNSRNRLFGYNLVRGGINLPKEGWGV